MDTILGKDTLEIFKSEIQTLYRHNEKYLTLSPDEIEAILNTFEFISTNDRGKVRPQMLYDLIQVNREK